MSHPLASLFGGGGQAQPSPFLMMTTNTAAPPAAMPTSQAPIGSPNSIGPTPSRPSFMSSAAPAAATGQTANKTLLGQ